jgi:uncharacterized protein (TIGR02266 family)
MSCGRRARRKTVDLTCRLRSRGARARRIRMTNLSSHGAWLRTGRPLADGARVEVVVSLADGEPIELTAEVMWSRASGKQAGMAVEWLELDDQACAAIAEAIRDQPDVPLDQDRFVYADVG